MSISSQADLQGMQLISEVVGITLRKMREYAALGMDAQELDEYGNDDTEQRCEELGRLWL